MTKPKYTFSLASLGILVLEIGLIRPGIRT